MKLAFEQIKGEVPKLHPFQVPFNVATDTMNVDLRDGRIRAWRDTTPVFYVDDAKSMFVHGCTYLAWNECVSAVTSTVDANVVLLVGRKYYAEQLRVNGSSKEYTRLGLPVPPPVKVTALEKPHKKASYPTKYVITYVNKYGQESAPSSASNTVIIDDEQGVQVLVDDLPLTAPPEYRIERVNIYRLSHPYRSGEEEAPLNDEPVFQLVDSVPIGTPLYEDKMRMVSLTYPIMTDEVREAPTGMQQIKAVPGTNTFVGFRGHTIHFSENNRYWNWPASFDMTLDRSIKHIEVVDGSLLVTTTGAPYIISDLKTCEKRKCRPVTELPMGNVGDIGCDQLNGSAALPFGMVYPTADGIMLLGTDGKMKLLTAPYFSTHQWERLQPYTTKLAYWSGLLLCVTEGTSFFIRLDDEIFATDKVEGLTRIPDKPIALQTNTDGQLFFLTQDSIQHWNSNAEHREFMWQNNQIGADLRQTFCAFRGEGMDASVKIEANGVDRHYVCDTLDDKPYRIGRLGRHRNYTLTVSGKGHLTYFLLGSSILEITRSEGA